MTMLGVQLFLLLLAAFLAGAIIACFLRRTFFARTSERAPLNEDGSAGLSSSSATSAGAGASAQSSVGSQVPSAEMMPSGGAGASRFGRALTEAPASYAGGGSASTTPTLQATADTAQTTPAQTTAENSAPEPTSDTSETTGQSGSTTAAVATAAVAAAAAAQQVTNGASNGSAATSSNGAASQTAPAPASPADDLTLIRGIDDELAARLAGLGVHRFSEISEWGAGDIARVSQSLGLTGRIKRESWIEQAQILAKGGSTDYQRNRNGRPRRFVWDSELGAQSVQSLDPSAEDNSSTGASAPGGVDATSDESSAASRPLTGMAALIAAAAAAEAASVATAASPTSAVVAQPSSSTTMAQTSSMTSDAAGLVSVRSEALIGTDTAAFAKAARGDDLKRIRGIGVLIETRLNAMGIRSYDQIANWSQEDVSSVSQSLDFKGRIERENWIEQARILSSGGETDFSRRVYRG